MTSPQEKRTIAVTIKICERDLKDFEAAGRKLWPGAVLSRAGLVLGLARRCATLINSGKDTRDANGNWWWPEQQK